MCSEPLRDDRDQRSSSRFVRARGLPLMRTSSPTWFSLKRVSSTGVAALRPPGPSPASFGATNRGACRRGRPRKDSASFGPPSRSDCRLQANARGSSRRPAQQLSAIPSDGPGRSRPAATRSVDSRGPARASRGRSPRRRLRQASRSMWTTAVLLARDPALAGHRHAPSSVTAACRAYGGRALPTCPIPLLLPPGSRHAVC